MQKIACLFIFIMVFSTGMFASLKSCLKSQSVPGQKKSISWAPDPGKPEIQQTKNVTKQHAAAIRHLKEQAARDAAFLEACREAGCTKKKMHEIIKKKINENKQFVQKTLRRFSPSPSPSPSLRRIRSRTHGLNEQSEILTTQAENCSQEQILLYRTMFPWVVGCFAVTSFALWYHYSSLENACITA